MLNEKEKDFGFYGDEVESPDYDGDIHGITDKVTDHTFTNLAYPCIVFRDGFKMAKHKVTVIVNMIKSVSQDKDINIYFQNQGELNRIGQINGYQVESLVDIVGRANLTAFLNEETELTGSLIYTLCSF